MATVTKAANSEIDGSVPSGTDLGRWANPSNAYATTGDNTYSTAVLGTGKNTGRASRFGFPAFTTSDIPAGSTINSVTVTVEWGYTVQVAGCTLGVQIHNPSGTALGTETTKTTATEAQSTQQVTSGITLSDLATAGTVVANVRFLKGNNATDTTGNLDFVTLTVDYSPPAKAQVSWVELEVPGAPAATNLTPASISHTRALGTPTVGLAPAGLAHTRAIGTAAVVQNARATVSWVELQIPEAPPVTNLTPSGLAHTRAQGTPQANTALKPSGLVRTRALGTSTVLLLQFMRPDADITATGWTPEPSSPATLYDKVNDQSSSTYITATAA
jgi:hypothetical protein